MTDTLTVESVAQTIEIPVERWHHQCHAISLAIVKSGVLGTFSRVARGFCKGVQSQHSWIVIGHDPYHVKAKIIDPTLWTYDPTVDGLWHGSNKDGRHFPHGTGSIWEYGRPDEPDGPTIELTPSEPFSADAEMFLDMIGPLDRRGWAVLAHAPVGGGWPAAEILAALADTEELSGMVPIDVLGMITDRNPGGLYLAGDK